MCVCVCGWVGGWVGGWVDVDVGLSRMAPAHAAPTVLPQCWALKKERKREDPKISLSVDHGFAVRDGI